MGNGLMCVPLVFDGHWFHDFLQFPMDTGLKWVSPISDGHWFDLYADK